MRAKHKHIRCANCRVKFDSALNTCPHCGGWSVIPPEAWERMPSMILTTGFEVEGRPISEYLGVITSEVVMGTGAIVEFLGGLADLFGTRSSEFEGKLEQAKEASLEKLKGKAAMLGADAIIGINIDYMNIAKNMLMVVANGTAVKLQECQ